MALRIVRKIEPRLELLMRNVYLLFVLFYDIELSGHRPMIGVTLKWNWAFFVLQKLQYNNLH
jgi:hypothetical protein